MNTADDWRRWFVIERLRLHYLLVECIAVSDTFDQKVNALYEHDLELSKLSRRTQKSVARADLVTVLARRGEKRP